MALSLQTTDKMDKDEAINWDDTTTSVAEISDSPSKCEVCRFSLLVAIVAVSLAICTTCDFILVNSKVTAL
jgi:hypothetical protein